MPSSPSRKRKRTSRRPILRFLARCLLYWGAALWLVSRFPAVERVGIDATVLTLRGLFGVLGLAVSTSGDSLFVGGTGVRIVADCSPHMPFLVYAAAVLAFPTLWRARLAGLLLGTLVIHAFNVIRIAALVGVLAWRPSWFEFTHVYLWQTGTVLLVFVAFAIWLQSLPRLVPVLRAP